MATAPKESSAHHQRDGGKRGGRGGGKIRKTAYRNTQATPYDRPLTALRNSNNSVGNTNGWLSWLVDPASKVIAASARKIFSSFISRRILPASAPKAPASVLQSTNVQQGESSMVRPMAGKNVEDVASRHPTYDIVDVAELEKMLKQKRFTRCEIDHLTTLLRSRTVNGSNVVEVRNPSVKIASEQVLKHQADGLKPNPVIPFYRSNGSTPTPASHKVFDEDITSPLDLAKAYMSSRASKCSLPEPEPQGPSLNSWTPNILQSASLKGSNLRKFAYGEPSSSVYELSVNHRRVSDFKNAGLKRRSSVLQDQYGSIGPIRRVRQKLNLLNSKDKDALLHESSPHNNKSTDKRIALADTPTLSANPAPTHFNDVVQQTAPLLDQPTYPQIKAVSNEITGRPAARIPLTSPSASETVATKKFINLEMGESSGIIKDDQPDNMMDDSRGTSLCDAGYSAMKKGLSSKNEQTKLNLSLSEKNSDIQLPKDTPIEAIVCDRTKSDSGPLQKKQAFRMSVLEDLIDMDEDEAGGIHSHNISASPNEERHPLVSLGANDSLSGRSRMGSVMGLETSDEPVIPEKRSTHVALPDGVSKLSTEASLRGQDDGLLMSSSKLETPDKTPSRIFDSSPIVASTSSGPKLHSPSDSKLGASRFASGPADVDRTPKQSELDMVRPSPEAAAAVLETASIFPFGDAANCKESASNSSSGSLLHSSAIQSNFNGDTKQDVFLATNSTIVGNKIGLESSSRGDSPIISRHTHTSDGGGLTNVKESSNVSEMAPCTLSAAPVTGSSAASTSSIFGSMASPIATSTSGIIDSTATPVEASDGALSSASGITSFAASSTSASSMNTASNFLFGASSTSGTGFAFGATTTPAQAFVSAAASNTGFLTSASTSGTTPSVPADSGFFVVGSSTPAIGTSNSGVAFGTSSAAVNTSTSGFSFQASSTTSNGLTNGALSTPATTSSLFSSPTSAIASSGLPSSVSSTPATTSSLFTFGASSAPATSGGLSFGALSTPATTSTGFLFGGASTTGTISSVFPSGVSSTPATTTSSGFGASLTPAATNAVLSFGGSTTPATTSSVFSFGASSTPAASSSTFSFGGSSSPAAANSGFSFGISSTPAATSNGFSFGGSSTPAASSSGFSFGASSTPAASNSGFPVAVPSAPTGSSSSTFLFGASSALTPVTSTVGFLSGSSSTFGASTTANPFSFGAASTPVSSTTNNGSPFGFTAGSSTFPFNSGTVGNTSPAQPVFGNTNPFSSTSAVVINNQTSMEDSMAEDSMQASPPAFPAFGAQQTANTSTFGFTAPNATGASNSFQFASQPNLANQPPFQSSASLGGFNAGGSFSLGSAGDKSTRRIIKPKKGVRRK